MALQTPCLRGATLPTKQIHRLESRKEAYTTRKPARLGCYPQLLGGVSTMIQKVPHMERSSCPGKWAQEHWQCRLLHATVGTMDLGTTWSKKCVCDQKIEESVSSFFDHTMRVGLPIRDCAGIPKNQALRGLKPHSTIDVTAKATFERLVLVPCWEKFGRFETMPLAPTPPPLTLRLFLDFRTICFPSGKKVFVSTRVWSHSTEKRSKVKWVVPFVDWFFCRYALHL